MKASKYIAFPIIAYACVAWTGVDTNAGIRKGPGDSPLKWEKSSEAVSIPQATAIVTAALSIGPVTIQPVTAELVQVTDRHPFGTAPKNTVWLIKYRSVRVNNPTNNEHVSVDLLVAVEANDNRLLFATTLAKDEWVRPAIPPLDPESCAKEKGWAVSRAEADRFSTSIPEVLEALWGAFGVDPAEAAQVVLRPRHIVTKYPAKYEGDKLVPASKPSDVWIAQVLGTIVFVGQREGQADYLTGLVVPFEDRTMRQLYGLYLP